MGERLCGLAERRAAVLLRLLVVEVYLYYFHLFRSLQLVGLRYSRLSVSSSVLLILRYAFHCLLRIVLMHVCLSEPRVDTSNS